MPRNSFGAVVVALATWFSSAPLSAQGLAIRRSTPGVWSALNYEGRGFESPPELGFLDSDVVVPLGVGPVAFGGTCTSGRCTNLVIRTPSTAFLEGFYAIEGAPLLGRSLGIQSGAINPLGIRLRARNVDTVTLPGIRVIVDWAGRSSVGLSRGNLEVRAEACDGSTRAAALTPTPISASTDGAWRMRRDVFFVAGTVVPDGEVCVSFVNTALLNIDVVALTRVEISVGLCGNGVIEPGEECDAGATSPCECNPRTCRIAVEGDPCAGETGPCFGHFCREGSCVGENLFEGSFVDACEDGDPCTFDGCREGACQTLTGCGPPVDVCHACDSVAHACNVPVPSCCLGDADCPAAGPCHSYSCSSLNVCELMVTPDCTVDAELPDGGVDAAALDAAAFDAGAFDAPPLDASNLPFDAGRFDAPPPPTVSFAGGGGCRCGAAQRLAFPAFPFVFFVLATLVVSRRR